MKLPDAINALRLRGYTFCPPTPFALESIPEEPGVYTVLASDSEIARVIGVRQVSTPWLRTDIVTFLETKAVIVARPAVVAFRVMEQLDGEHGQQHLARIADECSQVAESLRWPF